MHYSKPLDINSGIIKTTKHKKIDNNECHSNYYTLMQHLSAISQAYFSRSRHLPIARNIQIITYIIGSWCKMQAIVKWRKCRWNTRTYGEQNDQRRCQRKISLESSVLKCGCSGDEELVPPLRTFCRTRPFLSK